jgi:hypothetical protein
LVKHPDSSLPLGTGGFSLNNAGVGILVLIGNVDLQAGETETGSAI